MTRIKRFYKKVDVIEHPIMSAGDESIKYLDKDEEINLGNLQRIRPSESYFAISLDGRVIKTMYKNPLPIPSRALAVALAAEWDQQIDTIDMRQMHLNTMMAKAIKCSYDPSLVDYMSNEIVKVIDND